MLLKKITLFALAVAGLAGMARAQCPGTPGSVSRIVCLADSLKATLTASQVSTLQLSYSYANAQQWSNLPTSFQPRLGLMIGSMNSTQAAIALALVREVTFTNTANEGYDEVTQIRIADLSSA